MTCGRRRNIAFPLRVTVCILLCIRRKYKLLRIFFLGGSYELFGKGLTATGGNFTRRNVDGTISGVESGGGQPRAGAADAGANSSFAAGECLDLRRSHSDCFGESS